jgi:hypothetical protein
VVHTAVSLPGYSRAAFLDGRLGPPAPNQLAWIQQESTFWRRSLWDRCGSCIPLKYGLAADFHLWSMFFEKAPLYGVPAPLGVSRMLVGQRSRQGDGYVREMAAVLEEAKSHAQWKKSPLEQLRILRKVPLLRTHVKRRFGYQGRNLVMRDPELGGRWEVEIGKFG